MLLKIVYLLRSWVLGLAVLVFGGDRAKDAELVVLRHEIAVLRRHVGRVRYKPAGRAWFAVLARLGPRWRWAEVFSVTPATLLAWHRRLTAKKYNTSKRRKPGRPPTVPGVARLVARLHVISTGSVNRLHMGVVTWRNDSNLSREREFPMTMTVRRAFEKSAEAFNSHDIDGFADTLADDVVFRAPGGMTGEGKPACVQFFGGWLDGFPDAHVEIHDLHITGNVAVEEGTFTGTHHGVLHAPAGDVPATGRPVTLDYIQVLRFRDGEHVSFNLMYDRLLLLEQLGLMPAEQPAGLTHSAAPAGQTLAWQR